MKSIWPQSCLLRKQTDEVRKWTGRLSSGILRRAGSAWEKRALSLLYITTLQSTKKGPRKATRGQEGWKPWSPDHPSDCGDWRRRRTGVKLSCKKKQRNSGDKVTTLPPREDEMILLGCTRSVPVRSKVVDGAVVFSSTLADRGARSTSWHHAWAGPSRPIDPPVHAPMLSCRGSAQGDGSVGSYFVTTVSPRSPNGRVDPWSRQRTVSLSLCRQNPKKGGDCSPRCCEAHSSLELGGG